MTTEERIARILKVLEETEFSYNESFSIIANQDTWTRWRFNHEDYDTETFVSLNYDESNGELESVQIGHYDESGQEGREASFPAISEADMDSIFLSLC